MARALLSPRGMDWQQLVKGRMAEALVEAVFLESDYRVVRAGRESQLQATLGPVGEGHAADFVVWRRVGFYTGARPLHDVVVLEVKYRSDVEKWLPGICEKLIRQRRERRSTLHVLLVTDRPAPGRACFQVLRLADYSAHEPPVTRDLHE